MEYLHGEFNKVLREYKFCKDASDWKRKHESFLREINSLNKKFQFTTYVNSFINHNKKDVDVTVQLIRDAISKYGLDDEFASFMNADMEQTDPQFLYAIINRIGEELEAKAGNV